MFTNIELKKNNAFMPHFIIKINTHLDMELKSKIQFYWNFIWILHSEQELFTDLTETENQMILQN